MEQLDRREFLKASAVTGLVVAFRWPMSFAKEPAGQFAPNAFVIVGTDFVEKYPSLVTRLNAVFASEGVWANAHHEEVAQAQAAATGVDIEAIRRFVERSNYSVVPVDGDTIKIQQSVADRFARLGLIPRPVRVVDIVWKWVPGS